MSKRKYKNIPTLLHGSEEEFNQVTTKNRKSKKLKRDISKVKKSKVLKNELENCMKSRVESVDTSNSIDSEQEIMPSNSKKAKKLKISDDSNFNDFESDMKGWKVKEINLKTKRAISLTNGTLQNSISQDSQSDVDNVLKTKSKKVIVNNKAKTYKVSTKLNGSESDSFIEPQTKIIKKIVNDEKHFKNDLVHDLDSKDSDNTINHKLLKKARFPTTQDLESEDSNIDNVSKFSESKNIYKKNLNDNSTEETNTLKNEDIKESDDSECDSAIELQTKTFTKRFTLSQESESEDSDTDKVSKFSEPTKQNSRESTSTEELKYKRNLNDNSKEISNIFKSGNICKEPDESESDSSTELQTKKVTKRLTLTQDSESENSNSDTDSVSKLNESKHGYKKNLKSKDSTNDLEEDEYQGKFSNNSEKVSNILKKDNNKELDDSESDSNYVQYSKYDPMHDSDSEDCEINLKLQSPKALTFNLTQDSESENSNSDTNNDSKLSESKKVCKKNLESKESTNDLEEDEYKGNFSNNSKKESNILKKDNVKELDDSESDSSIELQTEKLRKVSNNVQHSKNDLVHDSDSEDCESNLKLQSPKALTFNLTQDSETESSNSDTDHVSKLSESKKVCKKNLKSKESTSDLEVIEYKGNFNDNSKGEAKILRNGNIKKLDDSESDSSVELQTKRIRKFSNNVQHFKNDVMHDSEDSESNVKLQSSKALTFNLTEDSESENGNSDIDNVSKFKNVKSKECTSEQNEFDSKGKLDRKDKTEITENDNDSENDCCIELETKKNNSSVKSKSEILTHVYGNKLFVNELFNSESEDYENEKYNLPKDTKIESTIINHSNATIASNLESDDSESNSSTESATKNIATNLDVNPKYKCLESNLINLDSESDEMESLKLEDSKNEDIKPSERDTNNILNQLRPGNSNSNADNLNLESNNEDKKFKNLKRDNEDSEFEDSKSDVIAEKCKTTKSILNKRKNCDGQDDEIDASKIAVKSKQDKIKTSKESKSKSLLNNDNKELNMSDQDSDLDSDSKNLDSDDDVDFNNSNPSYKPTNQEKMKLANMLIKLSHKVPPQHKIEHAAGTRALKEREREDFEQYVRLKRGIYSKSETKLVKNNWKAFCEIHDWDPNNPKPFLQMKYKNKQFFLSLSNRKKFVQFLANGLPNRSLYSVYQKFRCIYEPHKISRYKKAEDLTILNYLKNCKGNEKDRKFADLAILLKRTRASVWRRYRLLKRNADMQLEGNGITSI